MDRVYLLGYMGVGKSTVGKKLASRLGLKFIDLDQEIEKKEGRSASEIIQTQGENEFRKKEKFHLKKITEMNDVLVSTGGGTPCFFDNMDFMNRNGVTVYLQMDVKSLAKRLIHGMDTRPILQGKTIGQLEEFIKSHLSDREKFYKKANITFNAINLSADRLDELADLIREKS